MNSANPNSPNALEGIRVLDLTTARAELTGKVLADLGAEVIKVEPPEGAASRRLPPFDDSDADRSLYWTALALGKRSVVLDVLGSERDREAFHLLLAGADALLESYDPGVLAAVGLGYEQLAERYPQLIYTSVTPYGQDGPWAERPATELTAEAAGGLISLQGDQDRPPLPVGYPQAAFHAGVQAAADTLIALVERDRSGLGQRLDVSQQAAIVWTLMNATGYPPNVGADPPGRGDDRATFAAGPAGRRYPCSDGYVVFGIAPVGLALRGATRFLKWMQDEGDLEDWPDPDLEAWALGIAAQAAGDVVAATAALGPAIERIAAYIKQHTKADLFAEAVSRDYMLAPLYTTQEIIDDPHLAARDFWIDVDGQRYPGPFAKLTRTPIRIERAAPTLGQDQHLLDAPRAPLSIAGSDAGGPRRQPFAGLKVADFAWVGVGPLISKALADHGATVARIESSTRPDVLRGGPPFKDGTPGLDRSQFVANFNSSKLGVALNLATPEGLALARELIDWADVVVESFTPGTLANFGLDYASISKDRPDLVMLSTCLRGQTGPERSYAGFGLHGACLSGLDLLTGWPDRQPAGCWGAYTDFVAPRFGVAALATALLHRERTGEGQHVDLAQTEAGAHFVSPLLIDTLVNRRVAGPAGLDSPAACPHGTFRVAGTERYAAIAVETAAQWRALVATAGLDRWSGSRFDDLEARLAEKQAIEADLAAWCADQDRWALADRLAAAGVPAAPVERPSDLYLDPQLAHRDFFVTLNHSVMGPTPYDGLVTRFSATPGVLHKAGPALGEDTFHVLSELVGIDEDQIALAAAAGALE
ncbi:MAG: CoA transferase [Chloroflexi bacterium]|nr:CoA transferase [Chloroflexota bacterium]